MKEFKGTPKTGANWAINVNNPKQVLIENICIIDEPWSDPLVQADAYLISAAPDLLEACNAFINLWKNSDMRPEDESYEVASIVIMAIKKATNKTSV